MVTLKISPLFTAVTTEEAAIVGGGSSSAIPINNIQNHLAVQKTDFGTANLTFVKLEAPTQTTDESLILQLHIG